ncbi:hypothetical protein BCR37DRAFT_6679 [Protomyces lactucae-debilis]|uniref:DM2 domain-containing protein n=1 Tax=Protomyces lactucae-debilis TaxID=2754530 RepID=A0A1Y2FYK6_PROLT|nr:uncharacterized protein BCR37DRAFT_6679 [Protomyces lactucae-debilis]ORY87755.1 hypothetical protein BCR37DRAFT_6679 [Protomyces lactucae-debilis]
MASYVASAPINSIALPKDIEHAMPAADHYNRLLAVEKRLDAAIARKRFDLQDSLNRPQKVKRTLRVWCTNICHDQAWQVMDDGMGMEMNHFDFENTAIPGWTLRVEGNILEVDTADNHKNAPLPQFTDLLRSVVIESATPTTDDAYTDGPLFEWHKKPQSVGQPPVASYPGIELKRNGDMDVDLRIKIGLDHLPEKYKLLPKLAKVLDISVDTRPGIITALWHYIRLHKLQDSDEKRLIHCDQNLQDIFGMERIFFPKVPELLNKHLEAVDPIILDFRVRTDKDVHHAPAWDIEVELEDPIRLQMLAALKNLAPPAAGHTTALLDEELIDLVTSVEHSISKREFMMSFSETPSLFLQDFLASQDHDLNVIMGEVRHADGEQARRASYYSAPESRQWLQESVFAYLAARQQ